MTQVTVPVRGLRTVHRICRPLLAFLAACAGGDELPNDTEATVTSTLEAHGVVRCNDASLRSADGPYQRMTSYDPPNSLYWIWGGGTMAGDFDGDGFLEVLTPSEFGIGHYENPQGDFEQQSIPVTPEDLDLTFSTGGSVADYDGDGDLDVYVSRYRGPPAAPEVGYGSNRLLQNVGDGTFVDVTEAAGVDGCGVDADTGEEDCHRTMTSSWGDFDRDGDLDLFVGNYGWVNQSGILQEDFDPAEPSLLYRNEGDGTFTDISDVLPQRLHDGYTYAGGFFDLDGDGWLDLYTVNDFGVNWPNVVMWNDEGTLTFDPDDQRGLDISMEGMGLGVADLNDDGRLDLLIPDWKANVLLESSRTTDLWLRGGANHGFQPDLERLQEVGWGTEMGDVDNDGDIDAVTQYGFISSIVERWRTSVEQPDGLYLNEPDPDNGYVLVDRGEEWGMDDAGIGRGAIVADLDRDGWLDIAKRQLDADVVVYRSRCGEEGWLTVHLRHPDTLNTHAVGAKVVAHVGRGQMTRDLFAGGTSYGAGTPPELHFGLGDADTVDELVVYWPDGEVSVHEDIDARQQITITR